MNYFGLLAYKKELRQNNSIVSFSLQRDNSIYTLYNMKITRGYTFITE